MGELIGTSPNLCSLAAWSVGRLVKISLVGPAIHGPPNSPAVAPCEVKELPVKAKGQDVRPCNHRRLTSAQRFLSSGLPLWHQKNYLASWKLKLEAVWRVHGKDEHLDTPHAEGQPAASKIGSYQANIARKGQKCLETVKCHWGPCPLSIHCFEPCSTPQFHQTTALINVDTPFTSSRTSCSTVLRSTQASRSIACSIQQRN